MLKVFSWPEQEACHRAGLTCLKAYSGHDHDGDAGTSLSVRQLGLKGTVQTGNCSHPAPATAAGQECEPSGGRPLTFFLDDYVKFHGFKTSIIHST